MSNQNIKLCPCCGERPRLKLRNTGYGTRPVVTILNSFVVECDSCGLCTKPFTSDIYQTNSGEVVIKATGAEEAIEAWNKREEAF